MQAKNEDEEKHYKEFCANLTTVLKDNEEEKSMDNVELVRNNLTYYEKTKKSFTCIKMNLIFLTIFIQAFFPIIAHEHFYLVVFNLLKGTSVIIDNSNSGATYESKYSKECDILVSN